jgi:tetratricopeptide (TPR) repeat protein
MLMLLIKRGIIALLALMLLATVGCRKKGPEEMLTEAREALKHGDTYGAEYKLESIIKSDPQSPAAQDARLLWGNCLAQAREFEEARVKWGEVLQNVPLSEPLAQAAYRNRILSLEEEGKFSEAIAEIGRTTETLARVPDFAKMTYRKLADLYLENKEPKKAEAQLLQIKKVSPPGPDAAAATRDLGEFYVRTEQYDKAVAEFQELKTAAKTDEDAFDAISKLAGALARAKRFDEAALVYQDRLDKNTTGSLKAVLHWGIGTIRRVAAEDAKDPKAKQDLQETSRKEYETAIDLTQKELESEILADKKVMLASQVGNIYLEMGSDEKAIAFLQGYLDKHPGEAMAMWMLGRRIVEINLVRKNYDEAKKWLRKIAEALPNTREGQWAANQSLGLDQMLQQEKMKQQAAGASAATTDTLKGPAATTETLKGAAGAGEAPKADDANTTHS